MKKLFFISSFALILLLPACSLRLGGGGTPQAQKQADGGVFMSIDRGEAWSQKVFVQETAQGKQTISGTNVGFFTFHPTSSEILYLSTLENGLWVSENAGEQWTQLGLKIGYVRGFSIDPKDTNVLYAGYQNTVQKSTDGGVTWSVVYTNQPGNAITQVRLDPFDNRDVYATTDGGVMLKSDDQGTTWRILQQFPGENLKRFVILQSDSRIMFLVTAGKLLRSSDAGVTWTDQPTQSLQKVNALPVNDFTFTERTPSIMYVTSNAGLFRSRDGGATWNAVPTVIPASTVPLNAVAINPFDETELYFTAASTFYKSEDNGATWQTLKNVPSGRQFSVLVAHPRRPGTLYLGTLLVAKK